MDNKKVARELIKIAKQLVVDKLIENQDDFNNVVKEIKDGYYKVDFSSFGHLFIDVLKTNRLQIVKITNGKFYVYDEKNERFIEKAMIPNSYTSLSLLKGFKVNAKPITDDEFEEDKKERLFKRYFDYFEEYTLSQLYDNIGRFNYAFKDFKEYTRENKREFNKLYLKIEKSLQNLSEGVVDLKSYLDK